ncbi:MAG: hypothetical protein ACK578_22295, partial [Pirellula sp.]
NGSWVETTSYHPFWVVEGRDLNERSVPRELDPSEDEGKALRGRWVNSHELRAGDTIHLHDGTSARISRIEQRYESLLPVSNLTVRGFHTFFVGEASILVHNTSWCDLEKRAKDLLGPGVSDLQVRRKMIELVKGTNFSDHITKIHGSDALNRTKQQALDIGMPNIHGHHVKYKKAITDEDVLVQNTLMDYGIDPIYAKEVLVFAPNRGHTLAVNIGVGDSVRNAVEVARKQNLSYDETRQKIILALQQEAEDFIQSAWPDYFKHRIQK